MVSRSAVPFKTLLSFVNEKWGDRPCECCGDRRWMVGEMISEQFVGILLADDKGDYVFSPENIGEAVAIVCDNCGNIRMVSKFILDKWLDGQPGGSGQ